MIETTKALEMGKHNLLSPLNTVIEDNSLGFYVETIIIMIIIMR